MLLDKLESGIVALETERGPVYFQPTGWQRLYLLWTFRHFNSLPLKTLNSRQRNLVEKLPRCGTRHIGLDRMRVIGTVEGAGGLSFDECLSADPVVKTELSKPLAISAMQSSSPSPVNIQHSSRREIASSASGSKFISAIAAVVLFAALLIMGWHQVHAARILSRQRENSAAVVPEATSSANFQSETITASPGALLQPSTGAAQSSASIVVPAIINSPMPSTKGEPALDSNPVIHSKVDNSKPEQPARATYTPNGLKKTLASVKESMNDETVPRLQFSGPPSHLIYPSYPETNVRGKVTLKAVIGADGRVRGITILSGNKMLSAAAKRAVRQWRYDPIYKEGQPVEAETNIAMLFVADDVISISFPSAALSAQQ